MKTIKELKYVDKFYWLDYDTYRGVSNEIGNLLMAAPDLLDALQYMFENVSFDYEHPIDPRPYLDAARKAIAKALGEE